LPAIDQAGAVELDSHNRGSTCWSQAYHFGKVLIPGKVFQPNLVSWMKKWSQFLGERICGLGKIVFVIVAPGAGKCQITQDTLALFAPGNDVFEDKSLGSPPIVTLAIFTTTKGPLVDDLPLLLGRAILRHVVP
jgi:hypothetical protein